MITPAAADAITACGMPSNPNCGAPNKLAGLDNDVVTIPGVANPSEVGAATASRAWILAVAAAAATAAAGGRPPGAVEDTVGEVIACKPNAYRERMVM